MMPIGNAFYPIVHKRRSFSHEQELRAICWLSLSEDVQWEKAGMIPAVKGVEVPVHLDELVESIRLGPSSVGWFADLVDSVCSVFNLRDISVRQSRVDESYMI